MKIRLGLLLLTASAAGAAQSATPAQTDVQFEVASIRQNVSAETGAQVLIEPNGQLRVTNNTLFNIVRNAYGVQPFQIVLDRAPEWFNRDRWNILAKPTAEAIAQKAANAAAATTSCGSFQARGEAGNARDARLCARACAERRTAWTADPGGRP